MPTQANVILRTARKKLKVHDFGGSYAQNEIADIGRRYIKRFIALQDTVSRNPIHFCKTQDEKWVYFRAITDKLLTREGNDGIRVLAQVRQSCGAKKYILVNGICVQGL